MPREVRRFTEEEDRIIFETVGLGVAETNRRLQEAGYKPRTYHSISQRRAYLRKIGRRGGNGGAATPAVVQLPGKEGELAAALQRRHRLSTELEEAVERVAALRDEMVTLNATIHDLMASIQKDLDAASAASVGG